MVAENQDERAEETESVKVTERADGETEENMVLVVSIMLMIQLGMLNAVENVDLREVVGVGR